MKNINSTPSLSPGWEVAKGFFASVFLNLSAFALVLVITTICINKFTTPLVFAGIFAFSIVQLAYLIPLARWAWHSGRTGFMQGIIIAASITLLLNATCDISFFAGGMRIGG